ncbi:MAG: TetR/AcrR family transcriptional regulator [Oscillochloris sp.]|nr:TetR/AcrR family transcriptional regulator [Oscillochloris sp.]
MARTSRTPQQGELPETIKATAWQQIAESGAANLSLRAIARALNITAPAIYNYFPRRDDLVTALIIDAFLSFGDSQLAARDQVSELDLIGRLHATGIAYRAWAHTYPQRYQLIFGTPIPGYQAPNEHVIPAAARSMSALVSVVEALRQAGRLHTTGFPQITCPYEALLSTWKTYGGEVENQSLGIAIYIWSCVHGLVSLELSGNLPPFGPTGDDLFNYSLASLCQQLITEAP